MQIAVLATSWDAPMTLASSSFMKAVVGGAIQNGDKGLVILHRQGAGVPKVSDSIKQYPYRVLNSSPQKLPLRDCFSAAKLGLRDWMLFKSESDGEWQTTYQLTKILLKHRAKDEPNVLMVYPRSNEIFNQARIACKLAGWQIGCFATEQLTGKQINLDSKSEYIQSVVEGADVIWAVSSHLAKYWEEKGVNSAKIFVNPSVHEVLPSVPNDIHKAFSAAYVGNIAPLYWNMILDIAQLAAKEIEDFSLCVYCDVRDADFDERMKDIVRLNLESVVIFKRGLVSKDLFADLYSARMLLAPRSLDSTHQYGFPHKLGEYLLTGIPVVASAGGDIPEYFSDNELFLAPPGDTAEFIEQMKKILKDIESANQRASNGKAIATELLWSPKAMKRFREHIEPSPTKG